MAIIDKKQTRWYSKSTFDSLDKTTIPVGTEIKVTGELGQADFDSDTNTKLNAVPNKLDKPSSNPTENSVVTLTSTGTVGTKPLSEFAVTTTTPVTIPWSNLKTSNGITDQVRTVMTGLYEHSLYLRFIYNSWHAEVFITLLFNSDTTVTDYAGITNILGDTFYHEASGIITNPVEGEKYSIGYIQNISHNGLKVLIPN